MTKSPQTIGIIGGGQLGRMLASAAAKLGYATHIYAPEYDAIAFEVSQYFTCASYDDEDALAEFAESVDVITFEFENISEKSLEFLSSLCPVYPNPKALYICRNRLREKDFVNSHGINTAPYAQVNNPADLSKFGFPAILKTAEMGYDGKGQMRVDEVSFQRMLESSSFNNLDPSIRWDDNTQLILEGFADFALEISVIAARSSKGEAYMFPAAENQHSDGILRKSIIPARISPEIENRAKEIAGKLAHEMDIVGLLAVEMFVMKNGEIWVNEMAPRPHNSGHWSMDFANISQFEMLIRCICGLPLIEPKIMQPCEMINLIGDDLKAARKHMQNADARVHLYGKKEVRAGRKMGHINIAK